MGEHRRRTFPCGGEGGHAPGHAPTRGVTPRPAAMPPSPCCRCHRGGGRVRRPALPTPRPVGGRCPVGGPCRHQQRGDTRSRGAVPCASVGRANWGGGRVAHGGRQPRRCPQREEGGGSALPCAPAPLARGTHVLGGHRGSAPCPPPPPSRSDTMDEPLTATPAVDGGRHPVDDQPRVRWRHAPPWSAAPHFPGGRLTRGPSSLPLLRPSGTTVRDPLSMRLFFLTPAPFLLPPLTPLLPNSPPHRPPALLGVPPLPPPLAPSLLPPLRSHRPESVSVGPSCSWS